MSDTTKPDKDGEPMTNAKVSRRKLLAGGAALGGLVAGSAAARAAGTPDPLITEIQDWNRYLGDGVDARPYGTPSEFESHVVRRDVAWLTADSPFSNTWIQHSTGLELTFDVRFLRLLEVDFGLRYSYVLGDDFLPDGGRHQFDFLLLSITQ